MAEPVCSTCQGTGWYKTIRGNVAGPCFRCKAQGSGGPFRKDPAMRMKYQMERDEVRTQALIKRRDELLRR